MEVDAFRGTAAPETGGGMVAAATRAALLVKNVRREGMPRAVTILVTELILAGQRGR
jgi:hypothetical protein